jgi:hypothetical protein
MFHSATALDDIRGLYRTAQSMSAQGHQEKVNSVQFHGSCPLE